MSPDLHTVEGIARVVRVDGGVAWLEPEQTTSCGHCAASATCGARATGIGSIASRIELRRFPLDNHAGLRVGDRAVVGVADRSLLKAALLAYVIPLVAALAVGGLAESAWGSDVATLGMMAGGLCCGLLAARIGARRLAARGETTPRFLRRAPAGAICED